MHDDIEPHPFMESLAARAHVPDYALVDTHHRHAVVEVIHRIHKGQTISALRVGHAEPRLVDDMPEWPTVAQINDATLNEGGEMNKDVRKLVQALTLIDGVRCETSGGHVKVYRDDRLVTTMPKTPSDWRWRDNTLAELKRHGLTPGKNLDRIVKVDQGMTVDELRDAINALSAKRGDVALYARFVHEEVTPMLGVKGYASDMSCISSVRQFMAGGGISEANFVLLDEGLRLWRDKAARVEAAQAVVVEKEPVIDPAASTGPSKIAALETEKRVLVERARERLAQAQRAEELVERLQRQVEQMDVSLQMAQETIKNQDAMLRGRVEKQETNGHGTVQFVIDRDVVDSILGRFGVKLA